MMDKTRVWAGLVSAGVFLALGGGAAAAAAAATATLNWSTYVRAGPRQTAAALDELTHDVRVRVLGCDARWCHVAGDTIEGYVDRDALALPRTPLPGLAGVGDCVTAPQSDGLKPLPTRFCSRPTPAATPTTPATLGR